MTSTHFYFLLIITVILTSCAKEQGFDYTGIFEIENTVVMAPYNTQPLPNAFYSNIESAILKDIDQNISGDKEIVSYELVDLKIDKIAIRGLGPSQSLNNIDTIEIAIGSEYFQDYTVLLKEDISVSPIPSSTLYYNINSDIRDLYTMDNAEYYGVNLIPTSSSTSTQAFMLRYSYNFQIIGTYK